MSPTGTLTSDTGEYLQFRILPRHKFVDVQPGLLAYAFRLRDRSVEKRVDMRTRWESPMSPIARPRHSNRGPVWRGERRRRGSTVPVGVVHARRCTPEVDPKCAFLRCFARRVRYVGKRAFSSVCCSGRRRTTATDATATTRLSRLPHRRRPVMPTDSGTLN